MDNTNDSISFDGIEDDFEIVDNENSFVNFEAGTIDVSDNNYQTISVNHNNNNTGKSSTDNHESKSSAGTNHNNDNAKKATKTKTKTKTKVAVKAKAKVVDSHKGQSKPKAVNPQAFKKKKNNNNSNHKSKAKNNNNNNNGNNNGNSIKYEKLFHKKEQEMNLKLKAFESELLCIKKMKTKMQKQCAKYERLVSENAAFNVKAKAEFEKLCENNVQIEKERQDLRSISTEFQNDCRLLSNVLDAMNINHSRNPNKVLSATASNTNTNTNTNNSDNGADAHDSDEKENSTAVVAAKQSIRHVFEENRELLSQLRLYFGECSNMKNEGKKIELMSIEQKQLINDCKIHLQNLRSSHRENCLISLDKSKSFSCKECGIDIALNGEIESKCYQVGQGSFTEKKRGYLFKQAVNLVCGEEKTETFTTGSYQISWVSCLKCQSKIGWKYISADKSSNSAKIGKYCLSRYSLTSPQERVESQI